MSSIWREPTDVGPIAGGHLRIGDTERRQALELIDRSFREGRLAQHEYSDRLERVRTAVTFDDLVPVTRDLSPTAYPPLVPTHQTGAPSADLVVRGGVTNPNADNVVAIFGGAERRGPWNLRAKTNLVTVFGGADLDLSDGRLEAQECVIDVLCLFGGADIVVPDGVRVVSDSVAIFGGTTVSKDDDLPADAPTIRIRGFCAFGGFEVKRASDPSVLRSKHRRRRG